MQMTAPAREYLEQEMSGMTNKELDKFGNVLYAVNAVKMQYTELVPFLHIVEYSYNRVETEDEDINGDVARDVDKKVGEIPPATREKGDQLLKLVASMGVEPQDLIRFGNILVGVANIEMSVAGKYFD